MEVSSQTKDTLGTYSASSDRRGFIKTAAGAVGGVLAVGFPAIISAQTVTNTLKVGLVGCGGRGTGAAAKPCMPTTTTS